MSLVAYASSEESGSDSDGAPDSDGPHGSSEHESECAAYPAPYPPQPAGEQEQGSAGYFGPPAGFGPPGLGFHRPPGYYGPGSYNAAPPGYPPAQQYGNFTNMGYGNHANYPPPPPGINVHGHHLPPPQGGPGHHLPPPQGGPGLNLPPPQGGPGLNLPPPQGTHGINLPPPQGSRGLNLPHPQGALNIPPPLQGTTGISFPPPQGGTGINLPHPQVGTGMNLPPPQGGTGMNPQSPQGCTGMNLPSPQGRLVMSLPSPQSGMGMNLPSPQGGIGMNRPSPKGGMGMNLPPPQGSSQGLSLPQSSSGMNHPPPQDNPGMNQTPPPCTSSMNLPLPQGGSGHNYPPPISGHGMNLPPLHVSPGLSLPPPQGGLSLNITPPQLSPTSATGMECRLPVPPLGYGMNLPPPSMENVGSTKPKKRSEPVKISVPELHTAGSDSEEDEPTVKKSVMQGSREGLGLSSLLPQPKNASSSDSKRQFLPYIFTKKASDSVGGIKVPKSTSVAKPKLSLKSEVSLTPSPSAIKAAAKNAALQVTKQITQEEDDESDEDLQHGNYFSLSDTNETPAVVNENFSYSVPSDDEIAPPGVETPNDAANAPLDFKTTAGTINNQNWSTPTGEVYNSQQFSQYPEYGNPSDATYYQEYYNSAYYQEPDQSSTAEHREIATPDSFMDDEAFKRLQGKRNRGREEINFVDIKGDDQLSSNQQWLTKSLTEEKTMKSFSKRKGEQPTGQQRRKHQITYLIHQAKERELELKNTWSENKMSRRQTQAKYGF